MKKNILFLTTLFLFALVACAPGGGAGLSGTSWKLTSYGPASAQKPAAPDVETSLTFGTDGKLNGNLGCNGMGGDYTVQGDKLTFGSIMSTLMACDEPRMTQEGTAFQVLKDTASFKVDGSTLTITSADGSNVLVFTAAGK